MNINQNANQYYSTDTQYGLGGYVVDSADSRDLERRLALCRDALKWIAELYDDGKPSYQVAMDAYSMKCEAAKALAETAPKP